MDRENHRYIVRLAARSVATMDELIAALPELSPKLKNFGIWWLRVTKTQRAVSILLRILHDDPPFRLSCAFAHSMLGRIRSTREFIRRLIR